MAWIFDFILVLGGLIFFHELGHFLVARALGIGVKTFSLGFGPRLTGFTWGATNYRLSLIPLGGYVSLAGEERDMTEDNGFTEKELFMNRPPWHRMLVVAAGPIFNFVLAWIIFWGIILSHGQMGLAPKVGKLQPDSPAFQAGIKVGDDILTIQGKKIIFWSDLADTIQTSTTDSLNFVISRNGEQHKIVVKPQVQELKNIFGEDIRRPVVGIVASGDSKTVELSGVSGAVAAAEQTWAVTKLICTSIVKMVERVVPMDSIGGPIMIAQAIKQQSERGILQLLQFTAFISINLGLLNLLPIPVLDGGHLLFYGLETVLRRPLNERLQAAATRVGLLLLFSLMAFAIFNDIVRTLSSK
ncbi:RIP metalloprotease RseP [Maridesulfovibrio hydrothermalis]|uniref:Zinc metalloprotease n=1 Tax=Maridesulfovibrio hydrothermalis AM13 = DSM 14728 TaxID=1121451 RepID=L0REJ8_9BACT|nr:RIP metalloprotease RseP [Maridesulfovibrio hydrothermalis]CCO25189.1 Membrane-associated zinc metalloprotease [Maridesulfovibrio hydrothermalis AM13 = DSM 14728]